MDIPTLLAVLSEHYQKECLRQLYRVLGSVEACALCSERSGTLMQG